jgi:hypothetical protein
MQFAFVATSIGMLGGQPVKLSFGPPESLSFGILSLENST